MAGFDCILVCTKSPGRQDSNAKVSDSAPLGTMRLELLRNSARPERSPGANSLYHGQPLRSQEIILQGLLPKRGLGLLLALSRTLGADESTKFSTHT